MQSDFDEALSELFFQVFKLRVNMNRFENNFARGIFSINYTNPRSECKNYPEEIKNAKILGSTPPGSK